MKVRNSTKPGKCSTCQREYQPDTPLLLSDDGKELIGCSHCPSLQIKVKIKKAVEGDRLRWEPNDRWFKCDNCGSKNEAGTMRLLSKIDDKWVRIACPQCRDLTPIDLAALKLGPQGAAAEKAEAKKRLTEAQTWTVEQANDAGRREQMVGSWAPAAALLSHDPTLAETAARRKMDLGRLTSAFVTAAMLDPALAACTPASWVIAFRQALELGIYPSKGALALGYLIARGDVVCLQVGYKAASDIVLSLPDVSGLNTGVYWRCEAVLGNTAAQYHAAIRTARQSLARGQAPPPGLVEAAARAVAERGEAMRKRLLERLAAAKVEPARPSATEQLKHAHDLALLAALSIDPIDAGKEWYEWEWFRYVAADDLIVLDLPPPGIWARPTYNNAAGVVPAAAWALIRVRGKRDNVAEVIEAPRIMSIAAKGGNGKIEASGGMSGSVWGDDTSCDWMWRKTALLQAAVHGRLRLAEVDPERAQILEMLEPADPEAATARGASTHVDLASFAWARAAEISGRATAPTTEQRRPAPDTHQLPVDDSPPVLDIPEQPVAQPERVPVPVVAGVPSVEQLRDLISEGEVSRADAAFEAAGIPPGVPLSELSSEQREQIARHLRG